MPKWRWAVWWTILLAADFVFYVLLTPLWLGLRGAAWVAEWRSRRRSQASDAFHSRPRAAASEAAEATVGVADDDNGAPSRQKPCKRRAVAGRAVSDTCRTRAGHVSDSSLARLWHLVHIAAEPIAVDGCRLAPETGPDATSSRSSRFSAGPSDWPPFSTGSKRSPSFSTRRSTASIVNLPGSSRVRQLLPAERRRDRRALLRPHRVGGRDRLAGAVLVVVDEDADALALQPLRRDDAGVLGRQPLRDELGERVRLREAVAPRDRHEHVDALRAARLHVRAQLELVERLAHEVGRLARRA